MFVFLNKQNLTSPITTFLNPTVFDSMFVILYCDFFAKNLCEVWNVNDLISNFCSILIMFITNIYNKVNIIDISNTSMHRSSLSHEIKSYSNERSEVNNQPSATKTYAFVVYTIFFLPK